MASLSIFGFLPNEEWMHIDTEGKRLASSTSDLG